LSEWEGRAGRLWARGRELSLSEERREANGFLRAKSSTVVPFGTWTRKLALRGIMASQRRGRDERAGGAQ